MTINAAAIESLTVMLPSDFYYFKNMGQWPILLHAVFQRREINVQTIVFKGVLCFKNSATYFDVFIRGRLLPRGI